MSRHAAELTRRLDWRFLLPRATFERAALHGSDRVLRAHARELGLAQVVVDVSGRPYCVHTGEPPGQEYALIGGGPFPSGQGGVPYAGSLTRHVLETLAFHAHLCLHVRVLAGRDPHHIVEAQFKALARALRDAVAIDPRVDGVPSTKGAL